MLELNFRPPPVPKLRGTKFKGTQGKEEKKKSICCLMLQNSIDFTMKNVAVWICNHVWYITYG